ncbi:MAG: response regulator transcription factor [Candidatus Thiothrix singaporensis]|uniref:Response regulator transcription factor n=1 Tax=Candidatus Thiothrix singaporensis TaxID=2799669 RepID=A0A7L6AQT2_9GAMM|nr:MAG: response regulator transcription factor [Candidatus Thiothrix singaporensis]
MVEMAGQLLSNHSGHYHVGKVQPHERLQGLECGAQDYLVKPFHDRELLLRIKNLLSSSSDNSRDKLIQMGCLTLDKVNQTVTTGDGRESLLTTLECRLLQMFYLNAGLPLSREELIEQLMGIPYNPLNRSIDTHISRIRNKIEKIPPNRCISAPSGARGITCIFQTKKAASFRRPNGGIKGRGTDDASGVYSAG